MDDEKFMEDLFGDLSLLDTIILKYHPNVKKERSTVSLSQRFNSFSQDQWIHTKDLFSPTKPCFKVYFEEAFNCFNNFLKINRDTSIALQLLIPLKMDAINYHSCSLFFVPYFKYGALYYYYITIIPLKIYKNEPIHIQIIKNFAVNDTLSKQIRREIQFQSPLTPNQEEIFTLVLEGFNSSQIAKKLKKKKDNILKFHLRITERLSEFFKMEFATIHDAANYYKQCFTTF